MSEELLKAVIQFFAVVSKERITEEERTVIKDFLVLHLNQEATNYYLSLFDDFCTDRKLVTSFDTVGNIDEPTREFIDDWAQVMEITKKVNQALTMQQKATLVIKMIELVYVDDDLSERESNLIFYISERLKISSRDFRSMRAFVMGHDIEELEYKNILIVDEGSGYVNHPGPRIKAKNLTGLIAILKLSNTETYFIKYLGITSLTLNGTPMKSRKIDVFPTGSVIRGATMETIYYSDVVSKFLVEEADSKVSFVVENLSYSFSSGRVGLQNINIAETGGKLVGLMGASGSGKSTLLNVLNGSVKPTHGKVRINGIDIHKNPHQIEGVIGLIPQDDLLIEDLTVFENLYYSARLCFGQYTTSQCVSLVEKVLLNLDLLEIKNLRVGSLLEKTISGGERKRLNIGLELLREPAILFVDEPTSGLSSRDSENIMELLKELSLRGKMIFVVIHQPSSDIFKMFDSLFILDVGGFQVYYGNPMESISYFQTIINAANRTPSACPDCGNLNPEQIFNIIETRVVNEYGRFTHIRKISPSQWYEYYTKKTKAPAIQEVKETIPVVQKIPDWFRQWRTFVVRDIRAKIVNKQYVTLNLLLPPVLALFIGYFVKYYDSAGEDHPHYTFFTNENIPVYFFMSIVVALFVGLIISAEEIFRDRKILKRETYLNLSRSSYLFSKISILFSLSAIQTMCFILVGNWILEIPFGELRYWWILFSSACFANMLGLNISSAFSSAVTIYIIIPILIIPQLLLSGVVISFDKFNPKVGTPNGIPIMGEMMLSRWAFEAYMVTQFKDNPYSKPFYKVDQKKAIANYKRTYYIPTLESKLTNAFNQLVQQKNKTDDGSIKRTLDLLQNEITFELKIAGADNFKEVHDLTIDKFDSVVYSKTRRFFSKLKSYYNIRYKNAMLEKEKIMRTLTATQAQREKLENIRLKYQNQSVVLTVENITDRLRIIEWKGQLVQKIYPIYLTDYRPSNWFDFREKFYVPQKHFANRYFDTFYFNITIIWVMTILLYVALYFEVLKKIISGLMIYRNFRNYKKSLKRLNYRLVYKTDI